MQIASAGVAFWLIYNHYPDLLPIWLRPQWLQTFFTIATSLGTLSATIATILAILPVQSWFERKSPYIIPSFAERKLIRRVNYETLIARLGRSGQISWIDRKATSASILREHGQVAIVGWMKSGKTREATELIRIALEEGAISAVYEPTSALDLIDQEMLSQAIVAELDDRQRCLFFVDELGLRPEIERLDRLAQCIQTIRQRRPDTYFLITIQRERLIDSVQQWLDKQAFHLIKLSDLTVIQRQELVARSKDIFDISISQDTVETFARETDGRPYSIVFVLQQISRNSRLNQEDLRKLLNRSDIEAWAEQRRYIFNTEPGAEPLLHSIVTFASAGVTSRSSSIRRYARQLLEKKHRNKANFLLDNAAKRWEQFDIVSAGDTYTIPEPLLLPLLLEVSQARSELQRFIEVYQPGLWALLITVLLSPIEWLFKFRAYIYQIFVGSQNLKSIKKMVSLLSHLPFLNRLDKFIKSHYVWRNRAIATLATLIPDTIKSFFITNPYRSYRYNHWLINSLFSWSADKALLLSELGSDIDKAHHLSSNAHLQLGRNAVSESLHEEALANFTQAVALNPKNVRAIAHRGITYRRLKRYDEAITDFNQAINIDKNYGYAFVERGITYRQLERYDEAITDFNQAINIDKNYDYAFVNRGITYRQLERYDEAIANFNQAILRTELGD